MLFIYKLHSQGQNDYSLISDISWFCFQVYWCRQVTISNFLDPFYPCFFAFLFDFIECNCIITSKGFFWTCVEIAQEGLSILLLGSFGNSTASSSAIELLLLFFKHISTLNIPTNRVDQDECHCKTNKPLSFCFTYFF